MALEKYSSSVKEIAASQETVYLKLSNLKTLEQFVTAEKLEELKSKGTSASKYIPEDFSATEDTCTFSISPLGKVSIHIIERDPFKTIKFQGDKSVPFEVTCWIQLASVDEDHCKMKVTLHAELSMMIRMMVGSYLEKGIDQLAEVLSTLPYS